ncbi:MAG: hypothetical protein SFV23_12120 [Planctomycetaceae bacterium]|nr:hypothetical protein [Planctomycetaceae bacterium]
MESHIWINPARFRSVGEQVEVDGVDVYVQLSPFDAPTGIRGRFLSDRKLFEIQFEYMDSEVGGSIKTDGLIQFVEGRYSGKLLAIRIPVGSKSLDSVGLIRLQTEIVTALEKRVDSLDPKKHKKLPFGRFLNSKAAQEVVASKGEFESVARAITAL